MTRSEDHPHCPVCGQAAALPYTYNPGKHGVRCTQCGTLSRNGKTITITLPFEDENVARNAEKFIVGMED